MLRTLCILMFFWLLARDYIWQNGFWWKWAAFWIICMLKIVFRQLVWVAYSMSSPSGKFLVVCHCTKTSTIDHFHSLDLQSQVHIVCVWSVFAFCSRKITFFIFPQFIWVLHIGKAKAPTAHTHTKKIQHVMDGKRNMKGGQNKWLKLLFDAN